MGTGRVVEGLNTVREQIGRPSDAVYSDEEAQSPLPLSAEFQALLQSFIDQTVYFARWPRGNPFTPSMQALGEAKWSGVGKIIAQLRNSRKLSGLSERQKNEQEQLDVKCLQVTSEACGPDIALFNSHRQNS